MESWQKEIAQILLEGEAKDFADYLFRWTPHITLPSDDHLNLILKDLAQELPPEKALRLAFCLGAAWQKACDS